MSDAEALLSLKSSIDPFNSLQWRGNDACKWQGVKECMRGRVTKLVLEHLNLTGSLKQTSLNLNQLDQLRVLSFKDNSISGQIPNLTALVNLKSLYLNHNNFSGEFPTYISLFHRLKIIVLSDNQISGQIPNSLLNLRRLYVLHLQDNQFAGEIPPLNQSTLRYLNLSNNQLSGEIPVTPALIRFDFSSFSGNINLCGQQINRQCNGNTALAPSISPSYTGKSSKNRSKRWKLIAITAGSVGGILLLITLILLLIICTKKRKTTKVRSTGVSGGRVAVEGGSGSGRGSNNDGKEGGFNWEGGEGVGSLVFCGGGDNLEMSYGLEELLKATAETLGRGTAGSTYKAVMESGFIVTVKRLKDAKYPRVEDFVGHVELIGKLRHPNLVPLRAYFQAKEERLLVYDYLPNGSLFSLIHGTFC